MELIKIVNARQTLDSLSDKDNINAHLAYWMTKFVAKTTSEYEFYYTKAREIALKYATTNDAGEQIISADKIADFNKEVADLENTDVEDPGIKFALSELSQELKLSMKQMYPLLDFIEEDK